MYKDNSHLTLTHETIYREYFLFKVWKIRFFIEKVANTYNISYSFKLLIWMDEKQFYSNI